MYRIRMYSIALIVLISGISPMLAQNTSKADKALEKEWATKLKSLKPMQYKSLVEECENLKTSLQQAKEEQSKAAAALAPLESKLAEKEGQLNALQIEMNKLKTTLATPATQPKVENTNTTRYKTAKTSSPAQKVTGLIYKVQIGAFRNKNLTKYFENSPNFSGEVDSDGTKKYTLGLFEDYWEADHFKKYLREMGVTDAWIVAYKDGIRVALKDAREGVL